MVNVCIVGYGAVGPVHALALAKINEVNLCGICDIVKERADRGAKEYGAKAFYDFDECVVDEKIDFIHICTPHYIHFEMITKALNAGKRVVVEKPPVMKKTELDTLFLKYDTTKIFPIIQNRTNNCVIKLKELLETKKFGRLKGIKSVITWNRDETYYKVEDWRGKKEYEGGGVLINQAVHTLDLIIYLAGNVKSVSSTMNNCSLKGVIDVEDTVSVYMSFVNGASAVFYATNAYTKNSAVQIEFDCENANIVYDNGKLYVNDINVCSDSLKYEGKSYWGNGHEKTLFDLYEKKSKLCLDDVKNTMNTLFAIYESANNGGIDVSI